MTKTYVVKKRYVAGCWENVNVGTDYSKAVEWIHVTPTLEYQVEVWEDSKKIETLNHCNTFGHTLFHDDDGRDPYCVYCSKSGAEVVSFLYEQRYQKEIAQGDYLNFDELSPEEQAAICEQCGVILDSETPIDCGNPVLCGVNKCLNK